MISTKRKVFAALGLLALVATPALAAGLWSTYPIVGSAAFCSTTNLAGVPGTSSVCTTTTPAGPTVVTGLETIPADTHKASGSSPQTVVLTLGSLNALPLSQVTLLASSATNALSPTVTKGGVVIVATASLSPTTIQLPPSPIDGQQFRIASNQTISSLTVNSSDATVSNPPTALTITTTGAPYGYLFWYNSPADTWYRLQ
jgi:hypothetical protein